MDENITQLKCEIVTPEGLVFAGEVGMVTVPGEMGELGILPRHASLVSRTRTGEARVRHLDGGNDDWEHMAVGRGYVKMQFDRLLFLVDTAEKAVEIDVERAQSALERAERWLAKMGESGVDTHRAEQSRQRAVNRLKVAGKRK
jgi:F-type H+-transporting ATPase subunit epsilon